MTQHRWIVEQVLRGKQAALRRDRQSPLRRVFDPSWNPEQELAGQVDSLVKDVDLLSRALDVRRKSWAERELARLLPRKLNAATAQRTFCILSVADLLKEHFSHSSSEIVADVVTILLDEQVAIEPDLVKKLLRAR